MLSIKNWIIALLCCSCLSAWAAEPPKPQAPAPDGIEVGVYLVNVPAVNLKEKKFQLDFYLWFRWKNDELDPMENFEIVNGHVDGKESVKKRKAGGYNYSSARISATIYRNFVLNRYPLDDQALKLQIENAGGAGTMPPYIPDKAQSGVSAKIDVPGWRVQGFEGYASTTKYPTTFGDPEAAGQKESQVQRYTFAVNLKRAGWGNFIKLFSILFLAAGLAFNAFRIPSDAIDARIAFAASAVFMAVLTQSALSATLPETDTFGMADLLYNATMGFIAASFVLIVYTYRVSEQGNAAHAETVSRQAGWSLTVLYLLAVPAIVLLA
ncbi:hypothetical protein GCM10027277_56220 [Pseudoduganella ginsengisoli]|uniref:Neurotransmitter-gated ion-channel ligand-binding domain-containing protein n=1 Tax=Pseudoduganella ginsengisoli TaxID=1462440 RepID=A0A6L6Q5I8_9BURK|nr:hypothetical protein [Pseudoduganella ginsengisoli]MTW05153.1 hypothetical protein [Pseudoduganella ginsengisoli]